MGVEKLSIVEGPMYGLEENEGAIERAGDWMRSNGINPGYVALGALAGAALTDGNMVRGAAKWGVLVMGASYLLHRIR